MAAAWVSDILLFAHILSAIGWLGSALVANVVLGPLMTRFAPSTRIDLLQHFGPRFSRATMVFAGLTVLFGAGLYTVDAPGSSAVWGETIGTGILLALVAFVLGAVVTDPTSRRLAKLARSMADTPGGPPPTELPVLLRRLFAASFIGMLLLIAVLALMVAAAGQV